MSWQPKMILLILCLIDLTIQIDNRLRERRKPVPAIYVSNDHEPMELDQTQLSQEERNHQLHFNLCLPD